MLLAVLLTAPEARAQFREARSASSPQVGQDVNAFLQWEGADALGGVAVRLPAGWGVRSAVAVRRGARVALEPDPQPDGTVRLVAASPLRGAFSLVVGLRVGARQGSVTLAFTPLVLSDGALRPQHTGRAEWAAYVRPAVRSRTNRALAPGGEHAPLLLDARRLPDLGGPLTLEAWIRTTALGEVVLSTWDGLDGTPYPAEWVVDARGHLRAYRGDGREHAALVTSRPVADGAWHHVALAQDAADGWTRLLLDGEVTDSLRSRPPQGVVRPDLALGGRDTAPDGASARRFSGLLDEVRLWGVARTVAEVRRTMRVPLEDTRGGTLRLRFDEPVPEALLARPAARELYAPSTLSFAHPVEAIDAVVHGGAVDLTWETKSREASRFVVERSTDGARFVAVGTVGVDERVAEAADGTMRFQFADLPPEAPLLYYRVRQEFADEEDRTSATLKLGIGEAGKARAAILGNAPNPFRTSTDVHYEVAEGGPVRLSLWSVSGVRVAVLVDEPKPEGRHTYRLEPGGLPSGIYFVRLEAAGTTTIHKVTLTQ